MELVFRGLERAAKPMVEVLDKAEWAEVARKTVEGQ